MHRRSPCTSWHPGAALYLGFIASSGNSIRARWTSKSQMEDNYLSSNNGTRLLLWGTGAYQGCCSFPPTTASKLLFIKNVWVYLMCELRPQMCPFSGRSVWSKVASMSPCKSSSMMSVDLAFRLPSESLGSLVVPHRAMLHGVLWQVLCMLRDGQIRSHRGYIIIYD